MRLSNLVLIPVISAAFFVQGCNSFETDPALCEALGMNKPRCESFGKDYKSFTYEFSKEYERADSLKRTSVLPLAEECAVKNGYDKETFRTDLGDFYYDQIPQNLMKQNINFERLLDLGLLGSRVYGNIPARKAKEEELVSRIEMFLNGKSVSSGEGVDYGKETYKVINLGLAFALKNGFSEYIASFKQIMKDRGLTQKCESTYGEYAAKIK